MATDLSASFNEQYMNINTKLKKRFMRKPNIAEATNEFNALAIQCEHSEQPFFAGHAYIGAAKCESSAGNFLGEAEYYLAAARQFMKAEMKQSSLKSSCPIRENLEASIGCFMQALNKYPEGSSLRVSILMELANNLSVLGKKRDSIHYYKQALDIIDKDSMLQAKCMGTLLDLNVECGCYEEALKLANKICDSSLRIPTNSLTETQITRILLSLLIEPSEELNHESLVHIISQLLDDEGDEITNLFSIDLRLKLQSIIICTEIEDVDSLVEVFSETKAVFTLQQQDLLMKLIEKIERRV